MEGVRLKEPIFGAEIEASFAFAGGKLKYVSLSPRPSLEKARNDEHRAVECSSWAQSALAALSAKYGKGNCSDEVLDHSGANCSWDGGPHPFVHLFRWTNYETKKCDVAISYQDFEVVAADRRRSKERLEREAEKL